MNQFMGGCQLAEASQNPRIQNVLRDNIEKFNSIVADLLKERNPNMSAGEISNLTT